MKLKFTSIILACSTLYVGATSTDEAWEKFNNTNDRENGTLSYYLRRAQSPFNPRAFKEEMGTILQEHAQKGNTRIVSELLNYATELYISDTAVTGPICEAIHSAVSGNQPDCMNLLIHSAPDKETKLRYINEAFHSACFREKIDIAASLLQTSDEDSLPSVQTLKNCFNSASHIKYYNEEIRNLIVEHFEKTHRINEDEITEFKGQDRYNPFSSQNPAFLPGRPGFSIGSVIDAMSGTDLIQTPPNVTIRAIAPLPPVQPTDASLTADRNKGLNKISEPCLFDIHEFFRFITTTVDETYVDTQGKVWVCSGFDVIGAALRGVDLTTNLSQEKAKAIKQFKNISDVSDKCLSLNNRTVEFLYRFNISKSNGENVMVNFSLFPASEDYIHEWAKQKSYETTIQQHIA